MAIVYHDNDIEVKKSQTKDISLIFKYFTFP